MSATMPIVRVPSLSGRLTYSSVTLPGGVEAKRPGRATGDC
jgi:hypothetical protein